ncbi:MAG: cation transporter [Firmicutes bacterium]|nr:cation transporter [Bacillota bacterium]
MNKITKTICISVITNTILSIIKIIFGYIFKCSSLVADGIHSFSDLATDFVALVGSKLSNKPADKDHPFGHGKIEYITSIIIGLFILVLGFYLVINSYNNEIVIPDIIVMIITIITIISKYVLSSYVYNVGIKNKNNILIASGKESKADVFSSLIVLISIILMQLSNKIEILKYSDIIATIIVAIFIIKTGYNILKDNLNMILETQLDDIEYIDKIKKIILSEKEVLNIRDLYILINGPYYKLISNVNMKDDITLKHAHDVIEKIENKLKKHDEKIKYIFIHMEPNEKNEL